MPCPGCAQPALPGFGALNEEMVASWRRNLEQSLLAGAGAAPFPWAQEPASPSPTHRSDTPGPRSHTPGHTPSEGGDPRLSPGLRSESSRSPRPQAASPAPAPAASPLPGSGAGLVPRSFANTVNTPPSPAPAPGSGQQLSIPPLFTSRIPKGDPLEERLHDMLR